MSSPTTASIQLIRSATTKVCIAGKTFLIDPMLSAKGSFPGFEGTVRSEIPNPTVDLPSPIEDVLRNVDAVVVTHTHMDHWDKAAQEAIPKALPLFAQHENDAEIIRGQGFTNVIVLSGSTTFEGVTLTRTEGQHGCCAMYAIAPLAEALGQIMGVVFSALHQPTIYVVGDTIWREEVEDAIAKHKPDVVILYAGYAMLQGFADDSIIMGKTDTLRAAEALEKAGKPDAKIVAVHLESINHCVSSRADIRAFAEEKSISDKVLVPEDGELMLFSL